MLKHSFTFLAAFVLALPAFPATNPFAGTWKFNQEKSDLQGQTETIASLGKRENCGRNCNKTTVAENSSIRLSEPNASMAGLRASAAAYSETPHSTSIHASVIP